MKTYNNQFFQQLTTAGQQAERRRINANLHQTYDAPVQRLFISMEPDSYVRPHLHVEANKWEMFIIVKGSLLFLTYNDEGIVTNKVILSADDVHSLEIPPNTWHSTVALEIGTVFLEIKEGPYVVTTDKGFAKWSPEEGSSEVPSFLAHLLSLNVGDSAVFC